jgi:hypothetical protein
MCNGDVPFSSEAFVAMASVNRSALPRINFPTLLWQKEAG